MEIDADTIGTAHEMVVAKIMKAAQDDTEKCHEIEIETSPGKWEKTWEFHDLITVIIRNPEKSPQSSEAFALKQGFIDQYRNDLTHLKLRSEYPEGQAPVYTYPWRLMDHPYRDEAGAFHGNGDGTGINQIEQIISRLKENRESRRANAGTWVAEIDGFAIEDQPCLQIVHVLIRNGILHMRCFFRSHDMDTGAGANWIGLTGLMRMIADALGVEVGSLTTCSSSAHLYWKRDKSDLDKFRKHLFEKYRIFLGAA